VEALVAVEDWRRCRAAAVEGADLRLGGATRFKSYTNTSVGDPDQQDLHVFGHPGSGSISQRYGSGIQLRILPFFS
jgi:hypothetical protein